MLARLLPFFVLALLAAPSPPAVAQTAVAQMSIELAQAQAFLDQGRSREALEVLARALRKGENKAQAYLLRSTALIMEGDVAAGFADLQKALKLDPTLRQGWLNLAGLEIAEGRFDDAYQALTKARDLDPQALDNDLNLGAVQLMRDKQDAAARHFASYLAGQPTSAEAHFLVASNYALAGNEPAAIKHLRRAIELDEHYRLRARTDERFLGLRSLDYKVLLNTDLYDPPPSHHSVAAAFKVAYSANDNTLLYAVLGALQALNEPYNPSIEANPRWAIIWGKMRIKISNQANGTGVVSLSAPPESYTADQWHRRSQALFRTIHENLGG